MGEAITPRPPLSRRLLPRLLLVTVSLALSLLIGELAVRLLRPQEAMTITPRGLYVPDPPRRYRLRPGYVGTMTNHVEFAHRVAINGYGMRGREAAGRREPGVLRVLVLGDSFTFGVGAGEGETFPARLEARLRARGVPAEVWNAGAPGYGVPDEVAWYERWGVPLRPDVIVVAPFLANDLQDAVPGSPVRVVDGELVVSVERGRLRRWLYYHSHLFRLLKASRVADRLRSLLGFAEPWARREQRAELALYGESLPPALRAGAAATDAAIARLARAAAAHHARVVGVLVPALPQVDPRRWAALHGELGVDPRSHDRRRPNVLFGRLFAHHGVPVIDATEALAAAVARGQRIYFERDQHLTPAGYDLLAAQVVGAVGGEERRR